MLSRSSRAGVFRSGLFGTLYPETASTKDQPNGAPSAGDGFLNPISPKTSGLAFRAWGPWAQQELRAYGFHVFLRACMPNSLALLFLQSPGPKLSNPKPYISEPSPPPPPPLPPRPPSLFLLLLHPLLLLPTPLLLRSTTTGTAAAGTAAAITTAATNYCCYY